LDQVHGRLTMRHEYVGDLGKGLLDDPSAEVCRLVRLEALKPVPPKLKSHDVTTRRSEGCKVGTHSEAASTPT
jgi:hypothetical protein